MGLLAEVQVRIPTGRLAQLTNAGSPAGVNVGVNVPVLQAAVYDAQAYFFMKTGVPFDDTTPTGPPPSGNTCMIVGVPLVLALLYRDRGHAFPQAEVEKAWAEANDQLGAWARQFGGMTWAGAASDSVYLPSKPTPNSRPDFDDERLTRIVPNDPGGGPAFSDDEP